MARLKIYTDENVDVRVAEGLRRLGVDAASAYEERKIGVTDEAQLAYAAMLGAIIFTHDHDLIEIALEKSRLGDEHYGVIFAHMHRLRLGECIRRLSLYAQVVWRSSLWPWKRDQASARARYLDRCVPP